MVRATARNPAYRFSSADEMKQAIEEFIGSGSDGEAEGESQPKKRSGTVMSYLMTKFRRSSSFPAFSENIMNMNRLASSDSDTTIIELANAVSKDYSLTNKLLRMVNSSLYGQFGGQITTVSRAIAILGFDNIRTLAVGVLVFDQLKNRPKMKDLMEANMWYFVGAFMSRQIINNAKRSDTEMTFIAMLLNKLGTLLVIYYLPEEYEAINNLIAQQGLSEGEVAKRFSGSTTMCWDSTLASHGACRRCC